MRLAPVSLDQAEGSILAHNIAGPDGHRLFRKGRLLTADDVRLLRETGRTSVYVAELAPDDIGEDDAARRIAIAVAGKGAQCAGAASGRVNLTAAVHGVLRVDVSRVTDINLSEGITLSTLPTHSPVQPRQIIATIKIIPFAVPEAAVHTIEHATRQHGALIQVDELVPQQVGLILSGSASIRAKLIADFQPLSERITALGSAVPFNDFVEITEHHETTLSEAICRQIEAGARLILLAGETAIMDRDDAAPRAVEAAGGRIEALGAPVDPGNLLMLAYLDTIPIVGVPGCARSRKINVIDWVLPRLLTGERLRRADLAAMGHGGLLEDVPERRMPR